MHAPSRRKGRSLTTSSLALLFRCMAGHRYSSCRRPSRRHQGRRLSGLLARAALLAFSFQSVIRIPLGGADRVEEHCWSWSCLAGCSRIKLSINAPLHIKYVIYFRNRLNIFLVDTTKFSDSNYVTLLKIVRSFRVQMMESLPARGRTRQKIPLAEFQRRLHSIRPSAVLWGRVS